MTQAPRYNHEGARRRLRFVSNRASAEGGLPATAPDYSHVGSHPITVCLTLGVASALQRPPREAAAQREGPVSFVMAVRAAKPAGWS